MTNITLTADKAKVYEEVAKTTSYTGAKMGEEGAYDRIFTTDEDGDMLDRFWDESRNAVEGNLRRFITSATEDGGIYTVSLSLPSSFNTALTDGMNKSLFSFLVAGIISRWYTIANKDEAEGYATAATAHMDDILSKAYFRQQPTRPEY